MANYKHITKTGVYKGKQYEYVSLSGFDDVLKNLNKELKGIEGNTMPGLLEAAAFLRKDMDKTPPLIPLDIGNLRDSWAVVPLQAKAKPAVLMGFTANYALYVHEMMDSGGKKINWSRPNSGPKFFEAAIKRNVKKIIEIIAKRARNR